MTSAVRCSSRRAGAVAAECLREQAASAGLRSAVVAIEAALGALGPKALASA